MNEETKLKISKANKGKHIGETRGHYESSLKKLGVSDVRNIKIMLSENKLTQLEISKLYGVDRKTINNINIGKAYKTLSTDIDMGKSKKLYIKLNLDDYDKIKNLYTGGMKQSEIAKTYNVDASHISRIINNKRYIKTLIKNKEDILSAEDDLATYKVD